MEFKTKYCDESDAVVVQGRYHDGTPALTVMSGMGETLATVTVNLEAYQLMPSPGNVFIKNYSEAEGAWEALHKAGVVGDAVRRVPFGPYDAEAIECPLLIGNAVETR